MLALGITRWGFDRGFLDYINEQERTRLVNLASELAQDYQTSNNSWSTLTPETFDNYVANIWKNAGPPHQFRPKPPRDQHPPPKRAGAPPHRHGPPKALFSSNNDYIVGEKTIDTNNQIKIPIFVNGKSVGYIISEAIPAPTSPRETAFADQQFTLIWIVGSISIMVALLISLVLSRSMLAPIRQISARLNQLSSGDYAELPPVERKDELGGLLTNINHLGKKLASNKVSRSQSLANISHELRTPLTVILGEIEAMKDGIRPLNIQNLETVEKHSRQLKGLIDDLYELSVSDIGGLRYQFNHLDLAQCLTDVIKSNSQRCIDKGITVEFSHANSLTIQADSKRLEHLFQNLFENTLRYTESPGQININLSSNSQQATIVFEDSAPGVDKEHYHQLFEPLFRTEASRNRQSGGAGLGLAICRNIVEAHKGAITASPSSLGGIKIQIEFPLLNSSAL